MHPGDRRARRDHSSIRPLRGISAPRKKKREEKKGTPPLRSPTAPRCAFASGAAEPFSLHGHSAPSQPVPNLSACRSYGWREGRPRSNCRLRTSAVARACSHALSCCGEPHSQSHGTARGTALDRHILESSGRPCGRACSHPRIRLPSPLERRLLLKRLGLEDNDTGLPRRQQRPDQQRHSGQTDAAQRLLGAQSRLPRTGQQETAQCDRPSGSLQRRHQRLPRQATDRLVVDADDQRRAAFRAGAAEAARVWFDPPRLHDRRCARDLVNSPGEEAPSRLEVNSSIPAARSSAYKRTTPFEGLATRP